MGLTEELAAVIEHMHCFARTGLRGVGDVRAENPGMPGAETVRAFVRDPDPGR